MSPKSVAEKLLLILPKNPDIKFLMDASAEIYRLSGELRERDAERAQVLADLLKRCGTLSTREAKTVLYYLEIDRLMADSGIDPMYDVDIDQIIDEVLFDMRVAYRRGPSKGGLRYTILDKK